MKLRYWFIPVLALFFLGCEEILLEEDISNSRLTILAPVDNASFNSTSITFSWESLPDAVSYQIQIAKPSFEDAVEIILNTETTENSITQQLNVGAYQWRIKAKNHSSETSFITKNITIVSNDDFSDNVVVFNTPDQNLITNTSSQTISWQTVIGAQSYQLQITDNENAVILDETLETTSYTYSFPEGNSTFKVRASNGSVYTLYTSRIILVDQTQPNTPILTSPANNSSLMENEIPFSWTRTTVPGSIEFDSIYVYTNSGMTNLFLKERADTNPKTINIENTGTYFWKMKAFDQAGNQSGESSVFSFILN